MLFLTRQTLQASIRQTPEGRVYYPNGRAGYVLDAVTERNVARVQTMYFCLIVASGAILGPLGSWIHNRTLAMALGIAAVLSIRAVAIAFVLRLASRSATPFSRVNAVDRAAATYGAHRIWAMIVAFLLAVPMVAYTVHGDPPWEQAGMIALSIAATFYACIFAVRVLRAKAAMGSGKNNALRR